MVRPEGFLANDIAMEDHCLVGGLAHLLHLFPCQRSRNGVRLLDQASQKEIAFLPNDDASLFEPIVEEQSNPSHLRLDVCIGLPPRNVIANVLEWKIIQSPTW